MEQKETDTGKYIPKNNNKQSTCVNTKTRNNTNKTKHNKNGTKTKKQLINDGARNYHIQIYNPYKKQKTILHRLIQQALCIRVIEKQEYMNGK